MKRSTRPFPAGAAVLGAAVLLAVWVLLAGPAEARSAWTPAAPYDSPVEPMRVVELARIPPEPWLPGHRGVDLASEVGAPVTAPSEGVVTFAGWVVNRGVVTVQLEDGALSSVEPVDASVAVGERVVRGQVIGTVSAEPGHCAPTACVHWGVRVNGDYIDPLDVLAGYGPVRLLPRSAEAFRRRRPCATTIPVAS